MLWACGGSNGTSPDPNPDALDRKPILTHWVDNIIIPSYVNFKIKLDAMIARSDAFATAPDATTLVALRTAWAEAYTEWQKVELFEVGPGDKYTIRNFFNIYPADVTGIAQNIADPSVNMALPASFARQGFPALDYLINGLGSTDAEILTYYTIDKDASKRIAYLKRITDRMHTLLESVIEEWNGTYRETFISKTGLDIGSPMALMVNTYVLYYERYIRSGKFGIPSGAMASGTGTKYPEKVEAFYMKDLSLSLAKTAHQATIDFFNGKNVKTGESGPSFKSYLDALEAKDSNTGTLLSEVINSQFITTTAKMDLLSPNFYEQVQSNNQAMVDVYTQMQKAVRMLKVDMTSVMSITITYTDNDGD
ncbi:imelysin family protein [Cytophagaceae bacterium NT2B1]|nr:imelysin family protein [Xanthocytophaga flavus]